MPHRQRHDSRRRATAGWLSALVLALMAAAGQAQTEDPLAVAREPDARPADVPTLAEIDARIESLESSKAVEDAAKKTALEVYRAARGRLASAEEFRARAKSYAEAIDQAPARIAELKARLDAPAPVPDSPDDLGLGSDAGPDAIEQALVKARADLATLSNRLTNLDRQLQSQRNRPAAARERQSTLVEEQRKAEEELSRTGGSGEPGPVQEARRAQARARWQAASDERNALAQELASHDTRIEVDRLSRDVAARERTRVEARIALLEGMVAKRQRADAAEAKDAAEEAEQAAVGKHPLVRGLAETNAELGRELASVIEARERERTDLARVTARREEIEQRFATARQRLDIGGLSPALGQILLDERKRLEGTESEVRGAARRRKDISEVGLAQIRVEEQRRALDDLPAALAGRMEDTGAAALPERARRWVEAEARELLEDRRELLQKLEAAYADRTRTLGDLDFEQRQLISRVEAFSDFLDRNLLWTPSAPPIGTWLLDGQLRRVFPWLLEGDRWAALPATLLEDAHERAAAWAGAAVILVLLFRLAGGLGGTMKRLNERVGRVQTDRFALTGLALAATLIQVLPLPALLAFLGWRLHASGDQSALAGAAGTGFELAGGLLYLLLIVAALCHPRGLGAVHFKWPGEVLSHIRRHLAWFTPVAVPVILVGITMASLGDEVERRGLGRLSLIVALLAFALFLYRVLHPRAGLLAWFGDHVPDSWLVRLRFAWFPLCVGLPIGLAVLDGLGYVFTAAALSFSLLVTTVLIAAAVVLRALLFRWVAVTERQLRFAEIKEKRRLERAAREAEGEDAEEGAESPPEVPELDLARIDAQTRQLLNTLIGFGVIVALWLIWSEVVPALEILDRVALWEQSVNVGGETILKAVSLADVVLALIIAIIVVVAARNVPGALEMALLKRLPMAPSVRFAIATIFQYAIVAVGIIVAFNAIGIGWSKVQWLVAAVSVGLGFGLQEIFANFVSGLIILFERPVRIGDTVTVEGVTGTVRRIQIRATTLTDWDNREIVVPNKTFITGQLTNWSLSDRITRVVIRVGVAYGSDTELAHRLMVETARADPLVLEEPAPSVFFVGLGDSSLDFDVRLFVDRTEDRLPVTHSFHMAIEKKLREHGIEIPFPQRDIHVRSATDRAGGESGDGQSAGGEGQDAADEDGGKAAGDADEAMSMWRGKSRPEG